jgi:hypothetical protein
MDQLAGLKARRDQKDRAGSLPFAATPFVAVSSSRSGSPVPFRPVLVDEIHSSSPAQLDCHRDEGGQT